MMLSLTLLHGSDPRMELVYFLASVLTVLLPCSIFIYMAYRLYRTYLREKRETSRNSVEEVRHEPSA
jgi:hypothetical protein